MRTAHEICQYGTETSVGKTVQIDNEQYHHNTTQTQQTHLQTPHDALTIGLALQDLGGDISRGAALGGDREALRVGRKPKVGQLDVRVVALARQQQVLGLQVSVRMVSGWVCGGEGRVRNES